MTEAKDPDKKDAAPEPKTGPETSKAEPKEEKAETPASDEAAQSTDNSETSSKSEFEDALALDRRLGDFLLSLGFFTRLPVPMDEETAARPLSDAAWAFPVIGTIIGIVGGLIAALAAGLPALAAGLIAIGAMACLSGALHEDGLADCADGLWSGESAEARLAIMRDSRIGAFGVIALVIFIGLKASAIAQLLTIGG
ncbi:MAG TPA: hypothetical protein DCE33_07005, partial [Rhodospirillaceae bacterium]|nr:hypothetical protein [Rhodospirillaceae bacterium]